MAESWRPHESHICPSDRNGLDCDRGKTYRPFGIFFRPTGLLSWNVLDSHVDLEEELRTLSQHAPDGEVARHGE